MDDMNRLPRTKLMECLERRRNEDPNPQRNELVMNIIRMRGTPFELSLIFPAMAKGQLIDVSSSFKEL